MLKLRSLDVQNVLAKKYLHSSELHSKYLHSSEHKIYGVQFYPRLSDFLDPLLSFQNHTDCFRIELSQNIETMHVLKIIFQYSN